MNIISLVNRKKFIWQSTCFLVISILIIAYMIDPISSFQDGFVWDFLFFLAIVFIASHAVSFSLFNITQSSILSNQGRYTSSREDIASMVSSFLDETVKQKPSDGAFTIVGGELDARLYHKLKGDIEGALKNGIDFNFSVSDKISFSANPFLPQNNGNLVSELSSEEIDYIKSEAKERLANAKTYKEAIAFLATIHPLIKIFHDHYKQGASAKIKIYARLPDENGKKPQGFVRHCSYGYGALYIENPHKALADVRKGVFYKNAPIRVYDSYKKKFEESIITTYVDLPAPDNGTDDDLAKLKKMELEYPVILENMDDKNNHSYNSKPETQFSN